MCTQVFGENLDSPSGSLDCIADLRRNGFDVRPEDHDDDWGDDLCLCGVDVEGILDRSGRPYEWDPFGYALT